MGVSKNNGILPPNHPFVHRVGTIIFTIHFGGKIPLFLETSLYNCANKMLNVTASGAFKIGCVLNSLDEVLTATLSEKTARSITEATASKVPRARKAPSPCLPVGAKPGKKHGDQ